VANFLTALQRLSEKEGGYCLVEGDQGGETYRGLARTKQPQWSGWKLIDDLKKKPNFPDNLEADESLQYAVRSFYRGLWGQFELDTVHSQFLAEVIFDTAVNMGPSKATLFLQESANVLNNGGTRWPDILEDGCWGPRTLTVLKQLGKDERLVGQLMTCLRGAFYVQIMRNDPTQEKFARGWVGRIVFEGAT
jgi:lysozyme family protein